MAAASRLAEGAKKGRGVGERKDDRSSGFFQSDDRSTDFFQSDDRSTDFFQSDERSNDFFQSDDRSSPGPFARNT